MNILDAPLRESHIHKVPNPHSRLKAKQQSRELIFYHPWVHNRRLVEWL